MASGPRAARWRQIRYSPGDGKRSRVKKFDDVGCAVLWLDQQPWAQDSNVESCVNDHRDGQWLDARKAFYLTDRQTPMQYGLSAQTTQRDGALDFAAAREHICRIEKRFNMHGGNLGHGDAGALQPAISLCRPVCTVICAGARSSGRIPKKGSVVPPSSSM